MTSRTADDPRDELLRCALELLEESGHESLSVRTLATRAKLSSGAPYYHFPDRRALLVAIALEGFRELTQAAMKVIEASRPGRESLRALVSELLEFSQSQPRLFDLMYESELTRPVDPALEPAFQHAFNIVVNAVGEARGSDDRRQNVIRAVALWTSMFGLSRLLRYRLLEPFVSEDVPDWTAQITESAIDAALRPSQPRTSRAKARVRSSAVRSSRRRSSAKR